MRKSKLSRLLSVVVLSSSFALMGLAANAADGNKANVKTKQERKHKDHKGKRAHKFEKLAQNNPELAKELKALKDLPKEQRKAKFEQIKKKYPEFAKQISENHQKRFARIAKNNPELAKELQSLKNLPEDQRKAKMKELREKYRKNNTVK